MMIVVFAN